MITLAWYLLKVIIASGILCSYYFIALRNKVFHGWNRFYLLASVVISLAVPLMKVDIFRNTAESNSTMITVLQTINASDEAVKLYNNSNEAHITLQNMFAFLYASAAIVFLAIFFTALYKIEKLVKKYPATKLNKIRIFLTDAKGTPFSFFNSIFWNMNIDMHSKQGQQIFNHEVAHIKEMHSYDKIFMNIMLIVFWINPFFWLIRKEVNMIHEFIADKKAVEDSDLNSFAEMILCTIYPSQNFTLTNNFFYSPLKRRILMLTKNNNPKVNYLSRLLVLPVAAILFLGFTLHIKNINSIGSAGSKSIFETNKIITVIIDAGHGGSDDGAIAEDGLKEKDINLAIAKKIKTLNTDDQIKIILTRESDKLINPKERVEFAEANHPDIFISIHMNATEETNTKSETGFTVLIDKNNSDKNKLLASALINELQKIYTTQNTIGVRKQGVWVLDHNVCPSTIIECGYLTNSADEAFINNIVNQEKIARNILAAINDYSNTAGNTSGKIQPVLTNDIDTTPVFTYKNRKVKEVRITKSSQGVKVTYEDGTTENITETEAKRSGLLAPPPPPPLPVSAPPAPPADALQPHIPALPAPPPPPPLPAGFVYIDRKENTVKELKKVNLDNISLINVFKDTAATNR